MRRSLLSIAVVALSAPAFAAVTTWDIDPAHTKASFAVKHMMVSTVRGDFQKVTGTVAIDDKNVKASSVEASIDAASINTGVSQRDNHLKSPDFFDVAKYPTITFKSTSVTRTNATSYKVAGELTMHGVTKPVVLKATVSAPVKDMMGQGQRRGFEASTNVKRSEFGLKWNKALESGGVVVGDAVQITIDGELVSHAGSAAAAKPEEKAINGAETKPADAGQK